MILFVIRADVVVLWDDITDINLKLLGTVLKCPHLCLLAVVAALETVAVMIATDVETAIEAVADEAAVIVQPGVRQRVLGPLQHDQGSGR